MRAVSTTIMRKRKGKRRLARNTCSPVLCRDVTLAQRDLNRSTALYVTKHFGQVTERELPRTKVWVADFFPLHYHISTTPLALHPSSTLHRHQTPSPLHYVGVTGAEALILRSENANSEYIHNSNNCNGPQGLELLLAAEIIL
jgi:hypothetical protein